jgi:hypothetical protein
VIDAFARLVTRPEVVAERFNDVIGREGDVRRTAFDHAQNGSKRFPNCGDLTAISIPR